MKAYLFLSGITYRICFLILLTFSFVKESSAADYYLKSGSASAPQTNSSWNTLANGTGANYAGDFSTTDNYIIPSGVNATLSANWTVGNNSADATITIQVIGSLTISSGFAITLQARNTVGTSLTLTVDGTIIFSGTGASQVSTTAGKNPVITFNLSSGGTLRTVNTIGISGTGNHSINSSNFDAVNLNTAANYEFNGVSQAMVGIPATVNNLTFSGGAGTVTYSTVTAVNGNFTISGGATVTATGLLTIGGNAVISSSSVWGMAATTVAGTTTLSNTAQITAGSSAAKVFVGLLTIGSGTTFNMSASNPPVTIRGGITNNGTFTSGTGSYTFATNTQVLTGNFSFGGAVIFTSATSVAAGGRLTITGNLTSNGNLTLKSNASGTSSLGSSSGTATGNVNIEQFIPANFRKSRFLSHPFSSAVNLSVITDDIDITGNTTGVTSTAAKTLGTGFTATTTNNPSAYRFNTATADGGVNDAGWVAFTSADGSGSNNTWLTGQGIRVLVRGAKGQGLDGAAYTPSATTLTMSGTINYNNSPTFTLLSTGSGGGQGFNLVGNPLPSPIDISAVIFASPGAANINKTIYTRNPQTGAYASNTVSSGVAYVIPAYTAVLIKATSGSPVLTFSESRKSASSGLTTFKKSDYLDNGIQLKVLVDGVEYDNLNFAFGDEYTDANENINDGLKLANDWFDLYSISSDNVKLSTDMRPVSHDKVIPLGLKINSGSKNIKIVSSANTLTNNLEAFLLDKNTNTLTKLDEGNSYDLLVDANAPNTMGENRLQIVFKIAGEPNGIGNLQVIENNFTLYPNPATTAINLALNTVHEGEYQFSIFDGTGKEVSKGSLDFAVSRNHSIQIDELSNGIYFVKIGNDKVLQTIRFVK